MNTSKRTAVKALREPCRFMKRIGSTTFTVTARFSETSKETAGDKIARLIRMEAACGKAANE
jgi:hypothetical protein